MTVSEHHDTPPPPESWEPARNLALRVVQPLERFMHVEASSGLALLAAAIVALVWANSPWSASYDHLWHTPIALGVGEFTFSRSLHFWINDLLMAVFFLVVGLEIKREIVEGALSDLRRATLPVAAAIGGMVVPASIYFVLNRGTPAESGWGVPMATDIAFAVGVFALLGKRVPAALRVLLLAVAIIDDIGAIAVIAIFYSGGLNLPALWWVAGGMTTIFILHRVGVRPRMVYVIPGLVLWAGTYSLGIHPTIAGVIVGLMTPVKAWFGKEGFLRAAEQALSDFRGVMQRDPQDDDELIEPLTRIARARREAISPAKRIEMGLHPWVAFGIMPLFALANAGVELGAVDLTSGGALAVLGGVGLGLVVGKPLGILFFSWVSVRLNWCVLPPGVNWRGMTILGLATGIGFTMALFIAELAFAGMDGPLGVAKLGILAGTALALTATFFGGRLFFPREQPKDVAHITASDLEATTEYWVVPGDGRGAEFARRAKD